MKFEIGDIVAVKRFGFEGDIDVDTVGTVESISQNGNITVKFHQHPNQYYTRGSYKPNDLVKIDEYLLEHIKRVNKLWHHHLFYKPAKRGNMTANTDTKVVSITPEPPKVEEKPLNVTNSKELKKAVPDVQLYGNPDTWKLICKASSESQGWMKSTKAMEIPGVGCLVQVTTHYKGAVAEAVTFVPYVKIVDNGDGDISIVAHDNQIDPQLIVETDNTPWRNFQ